MAFHGACAIRGKKVAKEEASVLVFGGLTPEEDCTNLTYSGLLNGNWIKWKKLDTIGRPPSPRYLHRLDSNDKMMHAIVSGGRSIERQVFSDIFCFDLEILTWREVIVEGLKF